MRAFEADLTTIGGHIRAARLARGLTLSALSYRVGMPLSSLSRIERNEKPLIHFEAFVRELKLRPDELGASVCPHCGSFHDCAFAWEQRK